MQYAIAQTSIGDYNEKAEEGIVTEKNRDTALLCFNSAFFHGFFAQIRYWMIFCDLHVFLYTLRFSKTIQPELEQTFELIEMI